MSRHIRIVVLISAVFATRFVQPVCADWHVYLDDTATPGGILTAYVAADLPLSSVTGSIETSTSVVCRNHGVELSAGDVTQGPLLYAVVLAIPSDATIDRLRVRVRCEDAGGPLEYLSQVRVVPREFRSEEISLNSEMTDLRRSDAEEIAEQSRRLWAILTTERPESLYSVGPLRYPLTSIRYTSYFGDRRLYRYIDGATEGSIHYGIDFGGATGTPVTAAAAGRVVFAEKRIITGNTVILEHLCGVYTLYYHLNSLSVKEGELVEAGTQIGEIGATGFVTGPHLHWELRVAGVAVDPEAFISTPILDKGNAFLHIVP